MSDKTLAERKEAERKSNTVRSFGDDEFLEAGDDCPEPYCGEELFEIHHPRDARIDAPNHPDAPETEVVCIHDGVVQSR